MATPRRLAIRSTKQTMEILEVVNDLKVEIAALRAEITELKDALVVKPATRRRKPGNAA